MKTPTYTALLLGVMIVFFGGIYALWAGGATETYFAVMHGLGVDAYKQPFLDLTGVLSMGECHRLGIDVMKANPCDPLNRLLDYGPPLLHLPFRTADTHILGPLQDLVLLAAMLFVLRPRSGAEFAVAATASLSCGVIYALERSNLDASEFAIIAASGALLAWGRTGRFVSYALFYLGGTLKFYPFALLLTILREKFTVAVGLAVAGLAMIGLYAFIYRHNLAVVAAAMPRFDYDKDVFGAVCLPFGVADWLDLPHVAGDAMMVALLAIFGGLAWYFSLALRRHLREPDFNRRNFHYLLAGAIVLTGCFFMRPNITYRSIFLLLLLPGFFDLRRQPALRRLCDLAIAAALACLWSEFIRQWGNAAIGRVENFIAPARPDSLIWDLPSLAFFIARELLWWGLAALMAAIIAVFVLQSSASQTLFRKKPEHFGTTADAGWDATP